MNVRTFVDEVPTWLGASLEDFEREFTYPLGENTRFRISHGRDYLRFFRSMGECACAVAEKDGKVLGTICGAIQLLTMPDGTTKPTLYLGDLKITAGARGTRVLLSLARAIEQWARGKAQGAYSVVMDGTAVTPADYSGRAGIPGFAEVAKIAILRVLIPESAKTPEAGIASITAIDDQYDGSGLEEKWRQRGCIAHRAARQALRATIQQAHAWYVLRNRRAEAKLEDTRLAKHLLLLDGTEIMANHVSCFDYDSADDGADLLRHLAWRSWNEAQCPAFFVAVPAERARPLLTSLSSRGLEASSSAATVFATGMPSGVPWLVNTAEI